MKHRLGVYVLASLLGCRPPSAPRTQSPAAGLGNTSGGAIGPVGAPLVTRLEELSRRLAPRGVSLVGIAARGFIARGAEVTTMFDIPAGRCLSVVSLASPGVSNLDAHLFDPSGELLVEDVADDAHPTVQLCASEARRVYHVIETFEDSAGAYAIAAFESPDRQGLDEVARAMGGRPGTAGSTGANGSDFERRLNALRDGIAHRGFVPAGIGARAEFSAPGALRFPVQVTPDRCYTLAALGESEVRDIDLSVTDAGGEEIARDLRPEQDGMLQLCPATAGTLSVEVRVRSGRGSVLLSTFAAEASSVGGPNALWLGERTAWGASALPLRDALDEAARALSLAGFTPRAAPTRFTLAPAELREESLVLEGGRCAVIAAVAGRGVGTLRLEVFDSTGELLARGRPVGGASVAALCPPARETVRATLVPEAGNGEAGLVVLLGSTVPTWVSGVDRAAVSEAYAGLLSSQSRGWRMVGSPERVRLGGHSERVRELEGTAGRCTRLTASAGRGLPWVSLALQDPSGHRALSQLSEGSASVIRCSALAERLRIAVRTDPPGIPETDGFITRFEGPASQAAPEAPTAPSVGSLP